MKILLVNPRYPDTFFSFKHALRFISKKAAIAPLGLLTVAAMLPDAWSKRLLDMNIKELSDADIMWADYVFISAMSIQNKSVDDVVKRCNRLNVKIVAGGPLFTTGQDQFKNIDHLVLNEAEVTLPAFLKDLETG
ncbi:MAG: cobalamin B12-binding domain-containing protein, partial [Dehalococcoidia bacterium]|nr:cobalamin B12-binding domain-containing protein [Dehalococcoidia bacterium]